MADEPRDVFDLVEEGPEVSPPDRRPHERERDVTAERHPSVEALRERFPDALVRTEVTAGDQHVVYLDPDRSLEVLTWLRDDPEHRYDFLADVTAVDWGGGRPIQVVYQLWSIPHGRGLRLKCELPLSDLEISSVTSLWKAANWLEREVYDMFGVEFTDHPDLRRILMPENYAEGHPLRKDFPLRGRFSRAEQTRRALSQDPHDHYIPLELELGGEEFQQARGQAPTRPSLAEEEGRRVPPEATTAEPDMFRKSPHGRAPQGDEDVDASKREGVPEEGAAAPTDAGAESEDAAGGPGGEHDDEGGTES